jgi:hypothetical protein
VLIRTADGSMHRASLVLITDGGSDSTAADDLHELARDG